MDQSPRTPVLEILTLLFYAVVIGILFGYLYNQRVSNDMGYYIKDGYHIDGGYSQKLSKLSQLEEEIAFIEEEFASLEIPPEEKLAAIMALEEELASMGVSWTPGDEVLSNLIEIELKKLMEEYDNEVDDDVLSDSDLSDLDDGTSESFDWF